MANHFAITFHLSCSIYSTIIFESLDSVGSILYCDSHKDMTLLKCSQLLSLVIRFCLIYSPLKTANTAATESELISIEPLMILLTFKKFIFYFKKYFTWIFIFL